MVVNMLTKWANEAVEQSGLSQQAFERHLSATLGREMPTAGFSKMLQGKRKLVADEMIEIARLANYPLPKVVEAQSDRDPDVVFAALEGVVSSIFDSGTAPAILSAVRQALETPVDGPADERTKAIRTIAQFAVSAVVRGARLEHGGDIAPLLRSELRQSIRGSKHL